VSDFPTAPPVEPPPQGRGPHRDAEPRRRGLPFWVEVPLLVLLAFGLALLLKTFVVQAFYIPSASMVPTLEVNDRVLVNKVGDPDPERGDVIVFKEDGADEADVAGTLQDIAAGLGLAPPAQKDFIKRVIGLPGEELEVRDGVVLIDGRELPESTADEGGYLAERSRDSFGPIDIPEDEYFLMGDNRPNSADSRGSLGTVSEDEIVGRAFALIWPPSRASALPGGKAAPPIADPEASSSLRPDAERLAPPPAPAPAAALALGVRPRVPA